MAPLREKTSLGQRRDPCSDTRAGLPRRCRPALARTSRSNSFECQAEAARHGEPPSPGGRASGGALPGVAAPRGCSRGGSGASGPRRTCWGRDSPSVFTCRRGQERRSPHSAGRAHRRLWRPEHQLELAPHVAGRASFTAWLGGGGAERARGSCDRRLAKYRPSTADVCACAPPLALSRHLSQVERGQRQPGRRRGLDSSRERGAGRGFRVRSRSRLALLAAIFNEVWAGPKPVLGVSIAFDRIKYCVMFHCFVPAVLFVWFCP